MRSLLTHILLPIFLSALLLSCTKGLDGNGPVGSDPILFRVSDESMEAEVKADVTASTLQSDGFDVWAYHGCASVFSGYTAVYDSSTGGYSVSRYWPHASLGYGYSFVAASRNLPGSLYSCSDIDGDGCLDYAYDVNDSETELTADVVLARNSGSYTSGTVPLAFRHACSKISGIYVKAQDVGGAQVRVKEVKMSLAGAATMRLLSGDGIRWEIHETLEDTTEVDDPLLDALMGDAGAASPSSVPESEFESYFPFRSLFSGNTSAGTSSEVSLALSPVYVIPTDCLVTDGAVFTSPSEGMKLRVTYDVYVGGVLTESDKERQHRVTLARGSNYVFHLVLPVQASSGLAVNVEVVSWQTGSTYSESM